MFHGLIKTLNFEIVLNILNIFEAVVNPLPDDRF